MSSNRPRPYEDRRRIVPPCCLGLYVNPQGSTCGQPRRKILDPASMVPRGSRPHFVLLYTVFLQVCGSDTGLWQGGYREFRSCPRRPPCAYLHVYCTLPYCYLTGLECGRVGEGKGSLCTCWTLQLLAGRTSGFPLKLQTDRYLRTCTAGKEEESSKT
ncbi:hypothetical protein HD806DRAFT_47987 [Xylariaceae sp. AK1471]|nr:hypothetical protein HD806DRAFT_47987 [Xylariaceae sp. AK1471]